MSKQTEIWYFIADGARARVVRRDQAAGGYRAIRQFRSGKARLKTSELMSDRPGRVMESGSAARHAAASRHDPHLEAKLAFAREVAGHINHACRDGECDEFILVAPARTLGEIKKHLESPARSKLVSEISKDLTRTPDGDLGKHLDDLAHRIEHGLVQADGHRH
jgi:protein required for attachment to host cells